MLKGDQLVDKWNRGHGKIPLDKSVSQYAVEKEKLFPRGVYICELGGGRGVDAVYFLRHGHKVILFDIADQALKVAKNNADKQNLELEVKQLVFGDKPIPLVDESVDVVYSRLALHYFDTETTVFILKEIYRILRTQGNAYLVVKSPEDQEEMNFFRKTAKAIETGLFEDKGILKSRFTKDQWKEFGKRGGIKDFRVSDYVEDFGGRIDVVKSGKNELFLIEIQIYK